MRVNVQQLVDTSLSGIQNYATTIVQNALGIFTGVVGLLGNLFFVMIIGFILTIDGPRLRDGVLKHVPQVLLDEVQYLSESVDRTFGGFLRGQLIQSILIMVGTAVVMTLFGLNFVLIASMFSGLLMFIPLIGPFLALIPPVLVALFQAQDITLWVVVLLFAYQFLIVNVLMPRLLSDSLGLHPLLVFTAILVSVRIAGFWGAFFGIPVAGVLWAMVKYFFDRYEVRRSGSSPPR